MKAVIMAGGKGTRLRPLTCHLPKPMVPLLNRPCMEYIVELLKQHGIEDIAVTMQYLPEVIRNHFGDGRDFGVRMSYFEETVPLGTAGSVKNAHEFLDDTFLVISGDALTDFDLGAALDFHRQKQAKATLVLTRVSQPLEYGLVMTDDAGKITRFLEKPSWGEVFSDTVNTGIYILEPETLARVPYGQEYDFSQQLFPQLLQEKDALYGFVSPGYWSDIGNLQQYRQTQFDMLDRKVRVQIRGTEISPGVFVGEGVELSPGAQWSGPAFIGDHSRLEPNVTIGAYCVIGKHNRLAKGSSLSRSVLWDHNHIAESNELDGSTLTSRIICKEASYLGEGSVVGSGVVIGAKSTIAPHVKVWPDKQIRERSRVNDSFIRGEHSFQTLYTTSGVSGLPNVELTPELAARFATAYGAALASGRTLTVSCAPHEFARLIKRTVTASLQSVGVHVVDLGDAVAPAAGFAIRHLGANGGIHVAWSGKEDGPCCLECYDAQGLPIAKSAERKVENSYWQEDYGRAAAHRIGSYREDRDWTESYVLALAEETAAGRKQQSPLRIVVEADPWLQQFAVPYFERLGVEAIHVTTASMQEPLQAFVPLSAAHLGIKLGSDGRVIQLVTEAGQTVDSDLQTVFLYHCFLLNRPGAAIGAPVSAPHLLEQLAEQSGGRIVRTKELARAILEATEAAGMHPMFDAFFAAGLVVLHLERVARPMSELLAKLPGFYLRRERIECPWDSKGQVMRSMMERTKDARVELLDGIKFYHDGGWVLLLPDADKPAFQVVAQAERPEDVQTLIEAYREQILNTLQ